MPSPRLTATRRQAGSPSDARRIIYAAPQLLELTLYLVSGAFLTAIDVVKRKSASQHSHTGADVTWLPGDAWSQYCEAQP